MIMILDVLHVLHISLVVNEKMKEISAWINEIFLIFLRFFKLAFQAALYYPLIPRAPFNDYKACGLSIHFYLPWASISWPFRPGVSV